MKTIEQVTGDLTARIGMANSDEKIALEKARTFRMSCDNNSSEQAEKYDELAAIAHQKSLTLQEVYDFIFEKEEVKQPVAVN